MKRKTLWFDLETTGTDPKYHGILQFAGMVEIDGELVDRLNVKMQPHSGAVIEKEALLVNGITVNQISGLMPHNEGYQQILGFFDKHVSKYDRGDKMYPAGFNVRFDLEFLQEMFKRFNKYGIGSHLNWRAVDPLPLLYLLDYTGRISLMNYKLSTVCEYFGIPIEKAHDALNDVMATYDLTRKLLRDYGLEVER
ncbi:MAG: 3'-5' exonuclease [Chlorobium sp.]|uniref:3'-5' exonuclease n=1 Tax=Chlorobium sp. TaxID=1095 RepID=UPI002F4046C7